MTDKQAKQTAVAEQSNGKTVADMLEKMAPKLEAALQGAIPVQYFIRVALTTIQKAPLVLKAQPNSLYFSVLEAAQLRLALDGVLGHAYLVPFWSKRHGCYVVQLMTGYKGLIHMARRSGDVAKIEPRVVYEGDHFEYSYGLHPRLEHRPCPRAERGPWSHVYAIAFFRDQSVPPQVEVMPRDDVLAVRDRSPGKKSGKKSPWDTDEIPMALKTVIRRLCKWLPLSLEDQRQVEREEQFDARVPEYDVHAAPVASMADLAPAKELPEPEAESDLEDQEQPQEPTEEPAEQDEEQESDPDTDGLPYKAGGGPLPFD